MIKPEFMVASSEPMYDSLKLKLVCVSSGAPRLFDAVQDGVTDPSHSADSIGSVSYTHLTLPTNREV